jgi:multidrug resistance efflux pump
LAGRVVWAIDESDAIVPVGTELIKFDAGSAEDQLKAAEANFQGAKISLEGAKEKAEQYETEKKQQQEAVKAAEAKLRAGKTRYEELKRLQEKGTGGNKAEVSAVAEEIKAGEAQVAAEKLKLEGLELINPQLLVQRAEKEVDARQALRDLANKQVQEHILKAPTEGRVLRVLVNSGDMFTPDMRMPAVLFAPAGEPVIRVEVEQEFASRVRKGQRVCIQDDSNGQGRWTGVVTRIGDWYAPRRNILPEPTQQHDVRTLECIVEHIKPVADTSNMPLRINQRMRVTIYPEGTEPDDCKGN